MANTISSRTPEGEPNRCPVCRADVCLEPSRPAGDAPCPHCGTLLWFVATPTGKVYYEAEAIAPLRGQAVDFLCTSLRVGRDRVGDATALTDLADSLDLVELLMELEEEFGITLSDDAAEQLQMVGDLIHLLAQPRAERAAW